MTFVEHANTVRKRIPFAYWLFYDAVLLPVIIVGTQRIHFWGWVAAATWAVAVFFDINEAFVKWYRRHA